METSVSLKPKFILQSDSSRTQTMISPRRKEPWLESKSTISRREFNTSMQSWKRLRTLADKISLRKSSISWMRTQNRFLKTLKTPATRLCSLTIREGSTREIIWGTILTSNFWAILIRIPFSKLLLACYKPRRCFSYLIEENKLNQPC